METGYKIVYYEKGERKELYCAPDEIKDYTDIIKADETISNATHYSRGNRGFGVNIKK